MIKHIKQLWRRLMQLGRKPRFDAELDDEIQFHIESRAAELEQQGVPHDDAIAQARRDFGSPLRISETTREVWSFQWLEDLASDLRYAARGIRRSPAFAAAAIASLALDAGLNTAIFSFTMEFLFSEPSCRDAATLRDVRLAGNSHTPAREFRLLREAETLPGIAGLREESGSVSSPTTAEPRAEACGPAPSRVRLWFLATTSHAFVKQSSLSEQYRA